MKWSELVIIVCVDYKQVNIVGTPHVDSTTVFGVLLVHDIPIGFLRERANKRHLNYALEQNMLSRIYFLIKL